MSANKRAQPRFTPPAGIKAPQGGQARAAGERGAKRTAAKNEIFAAAGVEDKWPGWRCSEAIARAECANPGEAGTA